METTKSKPKRKRPSVIYWYRVRYYYPNAVNKKRRTMSMTLKRKRTIPSAMRYFEKVIAGYGDTVKAVSATCERTTIIVRTHQP